MAIRKEIPISTAKEELKRINETLLKPHMLIGGLAVQQYIIGRNSKDIDLVCDYQTVQTLITKLYPSRDYYITDLNDDEYRPSFEIIHRYNKDKMIFLGPKIWEREPYVGINWEELMTDAQPFNYKGTKLQNILVPTLEMLAFTKLLSFIARANKSPEKGKQDLVDFINLMNNQNFKINSLIDKIRSEGCEQLIFNKIRELDSYGEVWKQSLLMGYVPFLTPVTGMKNIGIEENAIPKDPEKLFTVENSVAFYDLIAHKYDERNTPEIFETHKKIITLINEKLENASSLKILDIGSGTGRLIAFNFIGNANITWHCIEPSGQMRQKFTSNLYQSKIKIKLFENSVFDIPSEVEDNSYDVIILSFVLTSLVRPPDFKHLSNLLSIDGIILIADIAPSYTQLKPLYDFQLAEETVTLAPKYVDPLDIASELLKEGLFLKEVSTIEKSNGNKYSFVLKFQY